MVALGEDTIRRALKDFGLTEKEVSTYIFLAKRGSMKGGEIAKQTKTQKAQVYRMLKSLQSKGLIEVTLETPQRFTAVPFESFIELSIKAKKEEALLLEKTKNELLGYWKSIAQSGTEPTLEKFVVIEGSRRIYTKISQMIKETRKQFAILVSIQSLLRADQYGLFNAILDHPLKSKIQFRFLTELNEQDLNAAKTLLREIPKTKSKIKGRNTDIGLKFSPRMAIRDEEEILFFITPKNESYPAGRDETCLWTNCTELVQAFNAVFEEEWKNSSEIETRILEMETGKSDHGEVVAHNPETDRENYDRILDSAKQEILILTSAEGLVAYSRKTPLFRKWAKTGVAVKVMAPITSENMSAAEMISKFYPVRHVPPSYLKTTIVDGKHLFQFETRRRDSETPELDTINQQRAPPEQAYSRDMTYSNNLLHVGKMKALLDEIWENSSVPSAVTLNSILEIEPPAASHDNIASSELMEIPQVGFPTYCSAQAIIHTPAHLNMPDIMFDLTHFGEPTDEKANWMSISLWLKTPTGYTFVPTAVVLSRGRKDKVASKLENMNKVLFASSPAGANVQIVKEHEFQMLKQGNTLFAGWTVPIPIIPQKLVLPPSFLLFEAYGDPKHYKSSLATPSGWKITTESDGNEAFVTFISPSSRYTGPGTDGRLHAKGFLSVTRVASN